MSDEVVIRVEKLGKRYRIRHQQQGGMRYKALRDVLADAGKSVVRGPWSLTRRLWSLAKNQKVESRKQKSVEDFWALKDVSFEVRQGETLGIIGRNGAGKSTLLKILSRITEPTEGRVCIKGRVTSLLEVGTGFHPELTGRENIFLNGAILGMHRAEIKQKFDEIVAFDEVEKFLDTPVKRFSSGMYVRLAFAVAAHLELEILIVDEVLAVGDAQFQKKCLGKMGQVSASGRTVLFVSHNLAAISSLCGRALLLEAGEKRMEGTAQDVLAAYIQGGAASPGEVLWDASQPEANNGRLRLAKARVLCEGRVTGDVEIDKSTLVQYDFEVLQEGLNVCTSIHLFDKHGTWVLCGGTRSNVLKPGLYQHTCHFPADFLNDGRYTVSIILVTNTTHLDVHIREALSFFVHETKGREEYLGTIDGCVRPRLQWEERALE